MIAFLIIQTNKLQYSFVSLKMEIITNNNNDIDENRSSYSGVSWLKRGSLPLSYYDTITEIVTEVIKKNMDTS